MGLALVAVLVVLVGGPLAPAAHSESSGCPSQLESVPAGGRCVSWPAEVINRPSGAGCGKNGGGNVSLIQVPLSSGAIKEDEVGEYVALWNNDQENQNPPPRAPWLFTATSGPNGTGSGPYSEEQAWSTTTFTSGTFRYSVPKGDGVWGIGGGSECPAPSTVHAWVLLAQEEENEEDEETILDSHPKKTIKTTKKKVTVKFSFSSKRKGATFKCKLDGGAFERCKSPKSYKVGRGKHTFWVRTASSRAKKHTPAKFAFKVVKKTKKKKKR